MPEPVVNSTTITNPDGAPPVSDPAQLVATGQTLPANSVVQASNPVLPPSADPAILQGSLSQADITALTSNWQQRLSGMQSLADTRLKERNDAIAAQTQMQQQYALLQEQAHTNLAAAAEAAQNAINTANALKAENDALKGELLRYQALEAHPHLAPYRKFIPTSGTEDELKARIAELEQIRQTDMAKIQAGQQPLFANPIQQPPQPQQGVPGAQPPQQVLPGVPPAPQPTQPNFGQQWLQSIYGNRPNMSPFAMGMPGQPPLMPGSTPAAMSPAGGANTTQAISQMLREARESGDMAKYEEATRRAAALVPQAIQEQLG